jgi:hypothetical protein
MAVDKEPSESTHIERAIEVLGTVDTYSKEIKQGVFSLLQEDGSFRPEVVNSNEFLSFVKGLYFAR